MYLDYAHAIGSARCLTQGLKQERGLQTLVDHVDLFTSEARLPPAGNCRFPTIRTSVSKISTGPSLTEGPHWGSHWQPDD